MMSAKPVAPIFKPCTVQMVPYIKEKLKMVSLMVEVRWPTKMVNVTRDNLIKVINMEKESTITLRANCTLETGRIMSKTEWDNTFMKMEQGTVANSKTIWNMAMDDLIRKTAVIMKVIKHLFRLFLHEQ